MKKILENELLLKINLIAVITGIIGFIYEVIFYKFDQGIFINRGTTLGPWIPVYAIGSILIFFATNKFKTNKLKVFIFSLTISVLTEFLTGFLLHKIFGIRLWDYNVEILNFGNIGGYICLRSVLLFSVGGLFLMTYIVPKIDQFQKKINKKTYQLICLIPGSLFLLDFMINSVLNLFINH